MFFDEARIFVKAGDGGNGIVAFRREKFVPRGGPSGGNGGRGGDVILVADDRLQTLIDFKKRSHFRAERGGHGGGSNMQGANGESLRIRVPVGTVVRNEAGDLVADLMTPGQEVVVARAGKGGRGNASFASASQQAPRFAEKGEPGEELWVSLELKLVADVGIVGVPNAGKSTLLAAVSAARPKIADYPFTTLVPNLGVAEVDHRVFVLADSPGLIEGASQGIGLGFKFLRHVERTRVLIHLVDGLSEDPLGDMEMINHELDVFDPRMSRKPQIVAFNKMDVPQAAERWPAVQAAISGRGLPAYAISAATGQGVQALLR
ncbi:MAG: GTPase ObgE, partial [Anaerolineae bacterium]|nr:GTPase ObgE [Anaerolineae bacterium]